MSHSLHPEPPETASEGGGIPMARGRPKQKWGAGTPRGLAVAVAVGFVAIALIAKLIGGR